MAETQTAVQVVASETGSLFEEGDCMASRQRQARGIHAVA